MHEEKNAMSIGSPTPRLLRLPQVKQDTGLSRSGIYSRIALGTFPAPVKLGHVSAWSAAEVAQWIAERIAARDAKEV